MSGKLQIKSEQYTYDTKSGRYAYKMQWKDGTVADALYKLAEYAETNGDGVEDFVIRFKGDK